MPAAFWHLADQMIERAVAGGSDRVSATGLTLTSAIMSPDVVRRKGRIRHQQVAGGGDGATGSKSFTGSKPVFLYSQGLITCALLVVSIRV